MPVKGSVGLPWGNVRITVHMDSCTDVRTYRQPEFYPILHDIEPNLGRWPKSIVQQSIHAECGRFTDWSVWARVWVGDTLCSGQETLYVIPMYSGSMLLLNSGVFANADVLDSYETGVTFRSILALFLYLFYHVHVIS